MKSNLTGNSTADTVYSQHPPTGGGLASSPPVIPTWTSKVYRDGDCWRWHVLQDGILVAVGWNKYENTARIQARLKIWELKK